MKILVTGAKGLLGTNLVPILEQAGNEVIVTDIEELDITDSDLVMTTVSTLKPAVIINCAAYTQVDRAEEETSQALLINGVGVQNLALASAFHGVTLYHISTDYVFSGEKSSAYTPFDHPEPINAYGWSKLVGEQCLQNIGGRYFLLRTSWLYGRGGPNFVDRILELAATQRQIRVVADQRGSPTWAANLAHFISRTLGSEKYGLYHVTDETDGGITWFDLAREAVRMAGLSAEVIPVTSEEFPRPATRPKNSVLDLSWTKIAFNVVFPDWKSGLRDYLKEKGVLSK